MARVIACHPLSDEASLDPSGEALERMRLLQVELEEGQQTQGHEARKGHEARSFQSGARGQGGAGEVSRGDLTLMKGDAQDVGAIRHLQAQALLSLSNTHRAMLGSIHIEP
jgi:hypothetical protein